MFESRCHAIHLCLRKTHSRSLFPPRCHCPPNFGCYQPGLVFIQLEVTHHTHCQAQRGRSVIEINGRRKNTRLDIHRYRIEIIGRGQPPAVRTGIKESDYV